MYSLIYFDTEDFFSPPDSPVHALPGQLAQVMRRHGLRGCFHIHGEKARFMERHGQTDVIEALSWHDISLHFDRGSVHPTTAEEVSGLDWFSGVDRVLFRELPGLQALQRIFGKCSGLTQHGGTFAAQIVYAAGRLGKPFLYSPFRLPGRNIVWYCGNLLIGGYQAEFWFDPFYRDTPAFDQSLARVDDYLQTRAREYDYTAMFGCHPVKTVMEQFPDAMNFSAGATPPPEEWVPPVMVPGVSIPLILENFERLIAKLVSQPNVEWTTVAGLAELYGQRPVRVSDEVIVRGADAVLEHGGPTFTGELSAGELLYLLARRLLRPAESYEVPQVMGPLAPEPPTVASRLPDVPPEALARQIVSACNTSGYLPAAAQMGSQEVALAQALVLLAAEATGTTLRQADPALLCVAAIPGVAEATERVLGYANWCCHGPEYKQPGIVEPFVRQCWTLKPAFTAGGYAPGVELGRHVNPMFDRP